jgi:hypothetical protein
VGLLPSNRCFQPNHSSPTEGHHNEQHKEHPGHSSIDHRQEGEQDSCFEIQREEIEARQAGRRLQVLGLWEAILSKPLSVETADEKRVRKAA